MSAAYLRMLQVIESRLPRRLLPVWNHPAGLKTIHFWAPAFKWGLVFAGLSDLARPAENLSPGQSGSLAATGLIWSRYSTVITPPNWNLFSVNVFLAIVGLNQLGRIYMYRRSLEKEKLSEN